MDSKKQKQSFRRRASSIFSRAGLSFARSKGDRGASVSVLRGSSGADFEATAIVNHNQGCGCSLKGSGGGSKKKLVLIKGPFIFIFNDEKAKAPDYAIRLHELEATVSPASKTAHPVVLKKTLTGEFDYEFIFSTATDANSFQETVSIESNQGQTDEIRKKLGHEHLLRKNKSIRYAEAIAVKKIQKEPEKKAKVTAEMFVRDEMQTIPY